jgi:hypothetical protein
VYETSVSEFPIARSPLAAPVLTLRVEIDPARTRRWQAQLVDDLRTAGHAVSVHHARRAPAPPLALALIIAFERLVTGRSGPHPSERIDLAESRPADGKPADLVVDLTGGADPETGERRLAPLYAGTLLEEAAVQALLARTAPDIGVRDTGAVQRDHRVRAAIEDRGLVTAALDMLGARLRTLLLRRVKEIARGDPPAEPGLAAPLPTAPWTFHQSGRALVQELRALLQRMSTEAPHWYIGWRRTGADRLSETMAIPAEGWQRIPDDGQRFYADPLVVQHGGASYLFLEEFPYATGKGILAYMPFGPDGPRGPARPVLETPYHLSYPFVFEHGGAMWLVPESGAAGRIDLYRADPFPERWTLVATLVDGVEASDATIITHQGRLYMFATVGGDGASTWDALHIWSADALAGPWVAHPRNPVLIDAIGARPAGAFYRRGGELWRPVQDCTTGYGAGLGFARIDRLDREAFAQTVAAVVRPGGGWPGTSIHTLSWAGGVEAVDGCEPRR